MGIEITRNRQEKKLCINQQGYITRILNRFGMEECKPVTSPMENATQLIELNEEKNEEKRFPYREAVGCLNYIATISRPDISYAVNTLARFLNNPQDYFKFTSSAYTNPSFQILIIQYYNFFIYSKK